MRSLSGNDCIYIGLFDKIFQVLFLLLPLYDLKSSVNPSAIKMMQDVNWSIVWLFFLHGIDFLTLFTLFQSSFYFHGLNLVSFRPF